MFLIIRYINPRLHLHSPIFPFLSIGRSGFLKLFLDVFRICSHRWLCECDQAKTKCKWFLCLLA